MTEIVEGVRRSQRRIRGFINNMVLELSEAYGKAMLTTPFEIYVRRSTIVTVVSFLTATIVLSSTFYFVMKFPWFGALMLGATVGASVALIILLVVVYYPYHIAKTRGESIRIRLMYTLSYMTAIAAAGMIPEKMFEKVAEIDPSKDIRREALRILRDIKMLGYDTLTVLRNRATSAPSPVLQEFYSGLRNVIITGGDLREYLSFYLRKLFRERSEELSRLTSALATISEIYITLLVAGPIITIITLSIMDIIGGKLFNLSPTLLMLVFLFVLVPFSATAILVIVDMITSKV